jgi:hypothetical protein
LPRRQARYFKARFSSAGQRWAAEAYDLPVNPYTNEPILLVPEEYLRPLPTINPVDFWGFCYEVAPETLRQQFGEEITRNVDKEKIIALAREHPELRERYVRNKEQEGGEAYNLRSDPEGYYQPFLGGAGWARQHALQLIINSNETLFVAINAFVEQFKIYVEDNGGWQLLWNDDGRPKKESALQALLLGVVTHYCRANNVDISKEANVGRGPVDFKFSQGYERRVLLEAKLASNTRFWNAATLGFGMAYELSCRPT